MLFITLPLPIYTTKALFFFLENKIWNKIIKTSIIMHHFGRIYRSIQIIIIQGNDVRNELKFNYCYAFQKFFLDLKYYIYLYVCGTHVCGTYTYVTVRVRVRRLEDSLLELALFWHPVGPSDWPQVFRLGGKGLHPLNYLLALLQIHPDYSHNPWGLDLFIIYSEVYLILINFKLL